MRSKLATLALVAGLLTGCAQPLQSGAVTTPNAASEQPNPAPSLRPTVPNTPAPQPDPQPDPQPEPQPAPQPDPQPEPEPAPPPEPPFEPVPIAADGTPALDRLKQQLQAYVSRQKGTYGVYLIDLKSGAGIGVNETKIFPTASTFKLPMSMYVMNEVAAGRASLDDKLTFKETDREGGTGILQNKIKEGDQFTLGQLVDLALTESDNIATNMICRRFGFRPVYDYMLKLGGTVTKFDAETIGTTPKDMATYMQQLRQPNGVTVATPELRQRLLDALARTSFHDRIEAGVPSGVRVAHKIGTLTNVINDVGLVYAPERPFILAVFSVDVRENTAPQVITEITRLIYGSLNS